MKKVFKVSDIKEMQKQVSIGMISYSRMVELMNELAHEAYLSNDIHNVSKCSFCSSEVIVDNKGTVYCKNRECKSWE